MATYNGESSITEDEEIRLDVTIMQEMVGPDAIEFDQPKEYKKRSPKPKNTNKKYQTRNQGAIAKNIGQKKQPDALEAGITREEISELLEKRDESLAVRINRSQLNFQESIDKVNDRINMFEIIADEQKKTMISASKTIDNLVGKMAAQMSQLTSSIITFSRELAEIKRI